ncbi:hypothetical protein ACHAPJ_009618 [Fusarium lateritium]
MAPARERCRTRSMGLEEDVLRPRTGNARVNKPTPKRRATQALEHSQSVRAPGRTDPNTARESLAAIAIEAGRVMADTAESTASAHTADETQDAVAGADREKISSELRQGQSAPEPASREAVTNPNASIGGGAIEEHSLDGAAALVETNPAPATGASTLIPTRNSWEILSSQLTIEAIRLDHASQATEAQAARERYEEAKNEREMIASRLNSTKDRLAACQREIDRLTEDETTHIALQTNLRRVSSGHNTCLSFGESLIEVSATLERLSTSKSDLNIKVETLQSEIQRYTGRLNQVDAVHAQLKAEMDALEAAEYRRRQMHTAVRIMHRLATIGVDGLAQWDQLRLWELEEIVVPEELKEESPDTSRHSRNGDDGGFDHENIGVSDNEDNEYGD